ncbi:MAG: hypothetical protein ACNS63_05900 [Candidatus Nitrospinota bacterium M3_3B_026]
MPEDRKSQIENEFISILLSAMKKGMSVDEFFALADATMDHLRGKVQNDTVEKVINGEASPDEVREMITSLNKKA